MKRLIFLMLLIVLGVTLMRGPKPQLDPSFNDRSPIARAPRLALANMEAQFKDITPGTEKTIQWANGVDQLTEWSLVYIHGFSATRQETSPLTETVGKRLGANVFFTRLAGHGRGSQALSEVDGSAWFADMHEAHEVGVRIGNQVAMIGVSTGATLATWLAADNQVENLDALILISPNFALADRSANVLNWPWGLRAAEFIFGRERSFDTVNDAHATYWTTRYAMRAAGELMALVKLVGDLNFADIDIPVLYIRSDRDRVIDMEVADRVFEQFTHPENLRHIVLKTDDPYGHVVAGDILSPSSTDELVTVMTDWLAGLPAGE